jgi:[ribosomal protein S5]-alanine N-acetyltransferase
MVKIELKDPKKEYAEMVYKIYKDKELFDLLGAPFPFEVVTVDFERDFLEGLEKSIKEKKEFAKCIFYEGSLVGFVGTKGIDYKNSEAEFGYWLGKKYWGKGITSEAVKQFILLFFENINIERLYAGAYKENIASSRVLLKNGFKKFKEAKVFDKFSGEEKEEEWFELKRNDLNKN